MSVDVQPSSAVGLADLESHSMGYNSIADIILVSATIFEIFTVKDRKLLISPTAALFYAP